MNRRTVGDFFAVLFVVGIVYVLVRPDSKAVDFVAAIGKFGRALVSTATDIAR